MTRRIVCVVTVLLMAGILGVTAQEDVLVSKSVKIVQEPGVTLSVPLAGGYVGEVDGAVVVAGGVTSADVDNPLDTSVLSDRLLMMPAERKPGGASIPAMAFGASCVAKKLLVCVGGVGTDGISAKVIGIPSDPKAAVKNLPDLPVPLMGAGAAAIGDTVCVAGGITAAEPLTLNRKVYQLDLAAQAPSWEVLTELPEAAGAGLLRPMVAGRFDDRTDQNVLMVMGGWQPDGNGSFQPSTESRYFILKRAKGVSVSEWRDLVSLPRGVAMSSAIPFGQSFVLVSGRAGGSEPRPLAGVLGEAEGECSVYLCDFRTDSWVLLPTGEAMKSGRLAGASRTGFTMLSSSDGAVIRCKVAEARRRFPPIAYAVVVIYVVGMLILGWYFDRKGKGKGLNEYVLGGRKVHWLVAGLSIYATGISAYSFAGIPGKSYAANWVRFGEPVVAFFGMMIVGYALFPLFRRLNLTTMTEYIELRFSKVIRTFSGVQYVVGQLVARMAGVVLLPAMALTAVTGLNIYMCILLVGILATIYTVMGGLNAVVWTDVAQVVVLFGGAIAAIIALIAGIDGGMGTILEVSRDYGKMRAFDWTPDLHSMTVWVFMLWGLTDMMGRLGQENMQRAFATEGENSARRSMITCAIISVPGAVIFFFIGTAVFVFYKTHPQLIDPKLGAESMFPLFMAQSMHPVIAGLVIAGLFAAAMSTLDSGMHSIATVITKDWFAAFNKDASDKTQLRTAKLATLAMGILGTLAAMYVASFQVRSVWDYFGKSMGIIGGGLAGVMVLALFTKRAHTWGVLLGGAVNLLIMIFWTRTHVHWVIYGITNTVIASVLGYVFSLIIPCPETEKSKDLAGLTLWTIRPK
ncbi:sodium/solute symporter [Verrucomicrobiota bacterium]